MPEQGGNDIFNRYEQEFDAVKADLNLKRLEDKVKDQFNDSVYKSLDNVSMSVRKGEDVMKKSISALFRRSKDPSNISNKELIDIRKKVFLYDVASDIVLPKDKPYSNALKNEMKARFNGIYKEEMIHEVKKYLENEIAGRYNLSDDVIDGYVGTINKNVKLENLPEKVKPSIKKQVFLDKKPPESPKKVVKEPLETPKKPKVIKEEKPVIPEKKKEVIPVVLKKEENVEPEIPKNEAVKAKKVEQVTPEVQVILDRYDNYFREEKYSSARRLFNGLKLMDHKLPDDKFKELLDSQAWLLGNLGDQAKGDNELQDAVKFYGEAIMLYYQYPKILEKDAKFSIFPKLLEKQVIVLKAKGNLHKADGEKIQAFYAYDAVVKLYENNPKHLKKDDGYGGVEASRKSLEKYLKRPKVKTEKKEELKPQPQRATEKKEFKGKLGEKSEEKVGMFENNIVDFLKGVKSEIVNESSGEQKITGWNNTVRYVDENGNFGIQVNLEMESFKGKELQSQDVVRSDVSISIPLGQIEQAPDYEKYYETLTTSDGRKIRVERRRKIERQFNIVSALQYSSKKDNVINDDGEVVDRSNPFEQFAAGFAGSGKGQFIEIQYYTKTQQRKVKKGKLAQVGEEETKYEKGHKSLISEWEKEDVHRQYLGYASLTLAQRLSKQFDLEVHYEKSFDSDDFKTETHEHIINGESQGLKTISKEKAKGSQYVEINADIGQVSVRSKHHTDLDTGEGTGELSSDWFLKNPADGVNKGVVGGSVGTDGGFGAHVAGETNRMAFGLGYKGSLPSVDGGMERADISESKRSEIIIDFLYELDDLGIPIFSGVAGLKANIDLITQAIRGQISFSKAIDNMNFGFTLAGGGGEGTEGRLTFEYKFGGSSSSAYDSANLEDLEFFKRYQKIASKYNLTKEQLQGLLLQDLQKGAFKYKEDRTRKVKETHEIREDFEVQITETGADKTPGASRSWNTEVKVGDEVGFPENTKFAWFHDGEMITSEGGNGMLEDGGHPSLANYTGFVKNGTLQLRYLFEDEEGYEETDFTQGGASEEMEVVVENPFDIIESVTSEAGENAFKVTPSIKDVQFKEGTLFKLFINGKEVSEYVSLEEMKKGIPDAVSTLGEHKVKIWVLDPEKGADDTDIVVETPEMDLIITVEELLAQANPNLIDGASVDVEKPASDGGSPDRSKGASRTFEIPGLPENTYFRWYHVGSGGSTARTYHKNSAGVNRTTSDKLIGEGKGTSSVEYSGFNADGQIKVEIFMPGVDHTDPANAVEKTFDVLVTNPAPALVESSTSLSAGTNGFSITPTVGVDGMKDGTQYAVVVDGVIASAFMTHEEIQAGVTDVITVSKAEPYQIKIVANDPEDSENVNRYAYSAPIEISRILSGSITQGLSTTVGTGSTINLTSTVSLNPTGTEYQWVEASLDGSGETDINGATATSLAYPTTTSKKLILKAKLPGDSTYSAIASFDANVITDLPPVPAVDDINGGNPYNNASPTWAWTKGSGVDHFEITLKGTDGEVIQTVTDRSESSFTPASALPGEGTYTIEVIAVSQYGLKSAADTATVLIDLVEGAPSAFALNSGATKTNNSNVSISTLTHADEENLSGWYVSESDVKPSGSDGDWSASKPTSYTLSGVTESVRTVYVYVKDQAGNISDPISTTIEYDVSGPTMVAPTYSTTDPTNQPVTSTIKTAEDVDAPTGWTKTGPTDGLYSFTKTYVADASETVTFQDSIGNTTGVDVAINNIDTSGPSAPNAFTINAGSASTNSTSATLSSVSHTNEADANEVAAWFVSESATPPGASDGGWTTKPSSHTLSGGDGTKTVYIYVKDAAGNVSTSVSDTIELDTTAPDAVASNFISATLTNSTTVPISLSHGDEGDVAGWYVSESSGTPDSGTGGWEGVKPTETIISSGDATKTVYVWVKDALGNVSSVRSDTIELDQTPPSAPAVADLGTVTDDQTPTWTCSMPGDVTRYSAVIKNNTTGATVEDLGSNILSGSFTPTDDLANGTYRIEVYAYDAAGNQSDVDTATVTVDYDNTVDVADSYNGPSGLNPGDSRLNVLVPSAGVFGENVKLVSVNTGTTGLTFVPTSTGSYANSLTFDSITADNSHTGSLVTILTFEDEAGNTKEVNYSVTINEQQGGF